MNDEKTRVGHVDRLNLLPRETVRGRVAILQRRAVEHIHPHGRLAQAQPSARQDQHRYIQDPVDSGHSLVPWSISQMICSLLRVSIICQYYRTSVRAFDVALCTAIDLASTSALCSLAKPACATALSCVRKPCTNSDHPCWR